MYDTLRSSRHKYLDSQIYVLYANGSSPSSGNCKDPQHAVSHSNVIDYAATKANLATVFNSLSSTMNGYCNLFIYTTDHGGNDSSGNVKLFLWGEYIWDYEFAGSNYLGKITSYQKEIIIMGQCYSGGFIDNLSSNKRIIETACTASEVSWSCDSEGFYEEFLFHFTSAVNWQMPNGTLVDADINNDNYVSMWEAWYYGKNHDSQPEHPQYNDLGNLGNTTYLIG
jgi:hypothetical protein